MKAEFQYTAHELEAVVSVMSDGNWHKSPWIESRTGVNARKLRYMSEDTARFIGSSDGYKLAILATHDEILRHVNSLRSRANKISLRADAIEAGAASK